MKIRTVALWAALCLVLVSAAAPVGVDAQSFREQQAVIRQISVEGTQRIEPSTVVSYLLVRPGDVFDAERIDQSLRSLFATGLFADVTLRREGDALVVNVVENPIINRIAFEGNQKIEEKELQAEVQLRPRVVYTRTRVQNDVDRILEIYRRNGRFSARVEPKIIQLDQNRVDLVFEIDEGPKTAIRRIVFVGNKNFSDSRLLEAIQTRQTRWYRIFSSDDTYDPDRIAFDRELLRRFYLSRGYADFRVVTVAAELTPAREEFFLTYTLDEGDRYKFGSVEIESQVPALPASELVRVLTTRSGAWYNAEEIDRSMVALTTEAGNRQFPFVEVRPQIRRNKESLTLDVTYQVTEGPRVFVERIDINGNVRTLDEVIRREMQLAEGDPFNTARLRRSEQRIRDLGFFEKVEITTTPGSAEDRTVVEVNVQEQSTGELTIGAGFSTSDGPLADLRIRERNLLGRGQDLLFATTIAGRRTEFDVSFTEPYFLGRDLSAGVDLFRITRDLQDESSFDQKQTGAAFRLGYPLSERLRQRLMYRFEENKISDIPRSASRFIKEQQGTRITSLVGQELTYDTRDSRLDPREGYIIRLSNELAGLGGDARFLRNRLGGTIYFGIFEEWVLSLSSELGYIQPLGRDVAINNRFFLGGDTLRGFAAGGVGPRDTRTEDSLGGNTFARGSVEVSFPVGLPRELGVTGHAFSDAGTLFDTDSKGAEVADKAALRVSAGVGLSWRSPLGPLRVDVALPILKENYDETEAFRFSFGTRF